MCVSVSVNVNLHGGVVGVCLTVRGGERSMCLSMDAEEFIYTISKLISNKRKNAKTNSASQCNLLLKFLFSYTTFI